MTDHVQLEPFSMGTSWTSTLSPETNRNVPMAITWWHHPQPDSPEATRQADRFRGFIRHHSLHEHMRHFLTGADGQPTVLELTGTSARLLNHPLDGALEDPDAPRPAPGAPGPEIPVPDPVPVDLGHDIVTSDMGVWVLIAPAQLHAPTLDSIPRMRAADVGMGRFALRCDDTARQHYADDPHQHLIDLIDAEAKDDPAKAKALHFLLNTTPYQNPSR